MGKRAEGSRVKGITDVWRSETRIVICASFIIQILEIRMARISGMENLVEADRELVCILDAKIWAAEGKNGR